MAPRELVHVEGRRATYSSAVSRVADSLSPLGTAARIIAELSACMVELRQLDVESQRIRTMGQAYAGVIAQRRHDVETALQAFRLHTTNERVTREAVVAALTATTRSTQDRFISEDERMIALQSLQQLSQILAQMQMGAGMNVVQIINHIVNGSPVHASWPQSGT